MKVDLHQLVSFIMLDETDDFTTLGLGENLDWFEATFAKTLE